MGLAAGPGSHQQPKSSRSRRIWDRNHQDTSASPAPETLLCLHPHWGCSSPGAPRARPQALSTPGWPWQDPNAPWAAAWCQVLHAASQAEHGGVLNDTGTAFGGDNTTGAFTAGMPQGEPQHHPPTCCSCRGPTHKHSTVGHTGGALNPPNSPLKPRSHPQPTLQAIPSSIPAARAAPARLPTTHACPGGLPPTTPGAPPYIPSTRLMFLTVRPPLTSRQTGAVSAEQTKKSR